MSRSLFPALAAALAATEIGQKLALTAAVAADWRAGSLDWQDATPVALDCGRTIYRMRLMFDRTQPANG